jgi:hypothetical protein
VQSDNHRGQLLLRDLLELVDTQNQDSLFLRGCVTDGEDELAQVVVQSAAVGEFQQLLPSQCRDEVGVVNR